MLKKDMALKGSVSERRENDESVLLLQKDGTSCVIQVSNIH